jgi:hypothetical protein
VFVWRAMCERVVRLRAQAFGGPPSAHWSRAPTPAEVRVMAHLGIARGAGGVLLYIREAPGGALVDASRALAAEVAALSPALVHEAGKPLPLVTRAAPSPRVVVRGISVPAAAAAPPQPGGHLGGVGARSATLLIVNGDGAAGGALTLFIPALAHSPRAFAATLFPDGARPGVVVRAFFYAR